MLNDWYALGSVQYRKFHVYDIEWDVPSYLQNTSVPFLFENYIVSGAPFGGPLAMIPDVKKVNLPEEINKNKILVYSCAGKKLAEIDWNDRPIIGIGWTDQENMVVVADNGVTKMFDLYGRIVTEFELLESLTSPPILECHFWGNGVAALTSDYFIRVAEGLAAADIRVTKPRIYILSTAKGKLGVDRTYTAMGIIPPLLSRSGLLEVLLATSDHSVLVLHESGNDTELEDQMLNSQLVAPITKISLAPDGRFLACYKKDGVLTVMGSAFNSKILDFDTRSASRPVAIQWCGKDCVILQWRNTGLVMVGPFGDWINFPYDSAGIHIIPEIDCCRIVTSSTCEILQMVPPQSVQALEIGSTDPAALILDAMEAFEDGDPKSDENIRTIAATNQLNDAVLNCISAAASEFYPQSQQRLLKAASYGKAFCPDLDPMEFVETAKKLRVLNEVRRPEIGLPLTIQQYTRLTPEVLVGRLTSRNCHFLALKICELLRLKNERVLIHWACEKIRRMAQTGATDDEINRTIKTQLAPYGRISYLAVAEAAYSIKRKKLATIILDREQQPEDQIPLLLKMNEEELALQKAITSEDTDLIYYTIMTLESRARLAMMQNNATASSSSSSGNNKQPIDNFYRIIHYYPEASNLLRIYYRQKTSINDRSILHNLLLYSKHYLEAGNAAVQQAIQQFNPMEKMKYFKESLQIYTISGSSGTGGSNKDIYFYKTMVEEELELMEIQKQLELRSKQEHFNELTVHEILQLLIELGQREISESRWTEQEIQKILKKFKISEKMIYYLKIDTYSKATDWNILYKFSNEKKSPVGYRPFATACLKYGAPNQETEKYIEKITVLEDKYELYMELKNYPKSMEMAAKLKDPYRLQEVGRLCQDPALERQIQDLLNKL